MDNALTFGNSAALLRRNGYATAACSENGQPHGPWVIRQHPYEKYPAENDALPVAVLTTIPAPRSELDPVQAHQSTWLATLRVKVCDEVSADIAAILSKYVGAARCPVQIESDGTKRYIFRTSESFANVQTDHAHGFDRAWVEAAPSFIPLTGGASWLDGVDLLDVQRAELPELDHAKAEALIGEINSLLYQRSPSVEPPAPYKRRPLLEPGKRLVWSNRRAINALADSGYDPCSVGDHEAVGLLMAGSRETRLCELEVRCARPDILGAIDSIIVARHGQGPVRVASDGSRLYLFKRVWGMPLAPVEFIRAAKGVDGYAVLGSKVELRIASVDVIVMSGSDHTGKPYEWLNGSPLTVPRAELPALDGVLAQQFVNAVEKLLESGRFGEAPKRRKTA